MSELCGRCVGEWEGGICGLALGWRGRWEFRFPYLVESGECLVAENGRGVDHADGLMRPQISFQSL